MRLDVVGASLLGLMVAGTAGAAILLAGLVPVGTSPLPCPPVQFVEEVANEELRVFRVASAEPRSTLDTWVWLQAPPNVDLAPGAGPYGFFNLHDAAVRPGHDRARFEDRAPLGVVGPGDRFVVPSPAPVHLVVMDGGGAGIGSAAGCGSPDDRMILSPGPAACYGIFLEASQPEGGNGTLFRVAATAAVWRVDELEYRLQTSEDAFLGGNLSSINATEAWPVRFVDAAPLGEVNVGDAFRYGSAALGLSLAEIATGRGVGGSYLCL